MNERVIKKKICGGLILALLLCLSFAPAESRQAIEEGIEEGMVNIRAKIAQTVGLGDRALMNVNNISLWFKSDGYSGGNPSTDNSGITFPPLTGQVIYRDGVIWGGRVLDGGSQEIRVGGQNYTAGTVPGAILSPGVAEDPFDPSVRIYRVRPDYQTADLRREAADFFDILIDAVTQADETSIREQYALDWQEWPWQKGAPFQDKDGDGAYDPSVDIPGFPHADQVAWFVVNDLDAETARVVYGSDPIGLEQQVTLWAYENVNGFPELDNVVFKQYRLVYKGTDTTPDDARIEEMYFAQWVDPDVGDYGDDLVGTDVELDLGYAYNSRSSDTHYDAYDLAPPAVGYTFLDRSLSSFSYWAAGGADAPELGEYTGTLKWYNILRGFQGTTDIDNPTPQVDPDGNSTLFPLGGRPTVKDRWLPTEPLGNSLEACGEDATCRSKLTPSVTIIEPGQTTGSEYTISFFEDAGGQIKWSLMREGEVVLDDQEISPGDLDVPEDGIQINLPNGRGMLDWNIPSGERWWTWAGAAAWGADGFGGAITGDPGNQWFEATTVERTRTVEVRFTSVVEAEGEDQYKPLDVNNENVSWGYRYLRGASGGIPAPGDLTTTAVPYDFTPYVVNTEGDGYPFQDRVPICLSAWDVDSDPPRRLEVGFLENLQPGGLVNGAYGPAWYNTIDNVAGNGPREWLFIFDLDYTDPNAGQNSDILLNSGLYTEPLPHMWIVFADRRQESRFPQDGDSFLMIPMPTQPYQDGDAFSVEVPFTTPPEGWIDGEEIPSGDRRMAIKTGPFDLFLGKSKEVTVLLAGGLGADNLESLDRLKDGVRVARDYYTQSNGGRLDIVEPPASNAGAQNLSIADAEAVPGAALETEIIFSGAAGIAGGELLLTYDPALLTPVDVATTEQTAGFVLDFAINTPGRLGIVLAGNTGLSAESGSLVNVVWEIDAQAPSGASSVLELETFALYDESTLPFSVEVTGGIFTVLNQAPLAEDDLFVVSEDESTVFDVLTNDEDLDGDDLTITQIAPASDGTVTIDSGDTTVTYTPNPDFHGKDIFTYTIDDGRGATATARAFITIKSVNDPPGTFDRLTPEEGGVFAREAVSFGWEAASDIDGDDLTYTLSILAGEEAIERTVQDTSLQIDFLALDLPVT
ncbi:MAG: cadherin-like domain-containing protein, partial [Gemmatimonadetes bacterium]|nr:cadherin-like domain-containing protein [Gemmatimonadota bacterium]